jgi:hypothetical protein
MHQPELALPLYKETLVAQRQAGAAVGETPEQFTSRLKALESNVKALEKYVKDQRDRWELATPNLKPEERAQKAIEMELAKLALDTMLDADSAAFGRAGINMEMELLLLAGRAYDVRDWLTENLINVMGELDFRWTRARMYAVLGDYELADEALQRMAAITTAPPPGARTKTHQLELALNVAQVVLDAVDQTPNVVGTAWSGNIRLFLTGTIHEGARFLSQYAEQQVLRGLLALEVGNIDRARQCFHTSLAMWQSEEAQQSGAGIDFNGRRLAQHYLQMIDAANEP